MLDALVVGGGPTGLTMALELARHGLSCRIVEQLPAPSPLSRALAVQARTLEIFEDLGIAEQAVARGHRAESFNLLAGAVRVRFAFELFTWLETNYPYILMLTQDKTEALLTERMNALGTHLERGVALEGFEQSADRVVASLKHAEGRVERVEARWLVGCDGARSRVRKGLGLTFGGETYEDSCVLADVRVEWSLKDRGVCIMPSRHGVVGAFPMAGEQRFRLFFIQPRDAASDAADDMAPLPLEEIQALVDRMVPMPARVSEPRWMSRYRLHSRGVDRYRQGRVFLAGDAAHIHSPVGGQGMNTGIQDAYNLAWKLALVTRGRVPDALLDTYEQERQPVGRHLLDGVDRAFSFMARGGAAVRLVRAQVVPRIVHAVFGDVASKGKLRERLLRWGSRFVSQLAVRYRHSPLSTERLWGEGARGGDGPAPGTRVPELPVKGPGVERLHQVLQGTQHTLLLFTGPSAEPRRRAELLALAARLETHYGALLRARVVVAGADTASAGELADADGALHRRFGAGSECFYLVRPDGYVGHREWPIEPRRLEAELARRMGT